MKFAASILTIALTSFAGSASAQSANAEVAYGHVIQCVKETRARGSYDILSIEGVPVVAASYGGSQRGAHNVNDCLKDKYHTQPGIAATARRRSVETVAASKDYCARLYNRKPGEAFVLGAGASLLGGAVGAGIHAEVVTQRFQKCARLHRGGNTAGRYVKKSSFGCDRISGVMQGGTGYCIE